MAMTSLSSPTEKAEELAARKRVESLARDLYGPVSDSTKLDVASFVLAAAIGGLVAVLTRNIVAGVAATAVGALVGGLIAWAWLGRAPGRGAFELISDHNCYEQAEWKTETGLPMPRTLAAARAWLREHPDGPGRATILVRLGRLAEARAVIDASETPETPDIAFARQLEHQVLELYGGGRPDVSRLHADWPSLPEPHERGHRRECLAILDAQIALTTGGDAWAVLAAARPDVGEVDASQRASRFALRLAALHVLALISYSSLLVVFFELA